MLTGLLSRFSFWPTLAAAIGIGVTAALGNWQLDRGHEKTALKAELGARRELPPVRLTAREVDPHDVEWRRVEVSGRFEPKYAVFLDNRVRQGLVGYHVVMPLKIGDSDTYVLVNRGWVAAGPSRQELPGVQTPASPVQIAGLAVVPAPRYLELSTKVIEGNVWQNLVLERYRQAVPIRIQPFVIEQESASSDGLAREWLPPNLGVERHFGYAFQWFALSALILVLFVVAHVRKRR